MAWIKDLKDNVVQLIFAITGVKTIKANQNTPRPKTDYITMLLSSSTKIGEEQTSRADNDGNVIKGTDRDLSISLQCISENAVQILEDLKNGIKEEVNLQTLRDAELAYVNSGDVIDVSAILGSNNMESRAAMDLFLRTAIVSTENVGIVDKISGRLTMVKPDGSTIENDYTIP